MHVGQKIMLGFLCLMFLALWTCFTWIDGAFTGARREQESAIKAGVGRWTIHPKGGDKRFEYGVFSPSCVER